MLDNLFNMELPLPVKLVVAFAIVLILLAVFMWVFKRFGGNRLGAPTPRGRQPRLAVIDAAAVDSRRRLVLIRRDNVEHLVMIGGPSDVLIEQNIMRAAAPGAPPREAPAREALQQRVPAEQLPRAAEPLRSPIEAAARAPRPERAEPLPRPGRDPLPRRDYERTRPESYEPPARAMPPESVRPTRQPPTVRAEYEAPPMEVHPAPPTADAGLADMAHRLEAALRRPAAKRGEPGESPNAPALTEPTPPTAPEVEGNGSRSYPSADPSAGASPRPEVRNQRAEPKPGAGKSMFDSLEEEMASLLGKPPEKK